MTAVPDLVDRIDDLLPQTQCTRCGYAGCRPYAEAIVAGNADINRCPPGGETTIAALASLLAREPVPLDTTRGTPGPLLVARIDESACIGCTLCIKACPVDAIIGANKRMHGVLESLCSGCELCVRSCPVDCITMAPAARAWTAADAMLARERHEQRQRRRARASAISRERAVAAALGDDAARRRAAIAKAIERARVRRRQAP
jgi:electron transport complex protein RnfB